MKHLRSFDFERDKRVIENLVDDCLPNLRNNAGLIYDLLYDVKDADNQNLINDASFHILITNGIESDIAYRAPTITQTISNKEFKFDVSSWGLANNDKFETEFLPQLEFEFSFNPLTFYDTRNILTDAVRTNKSSVSIMRSFCESLHHFSEALSHELNLKVYNHYTNYSFTTIDRNIPQREDKNPINLNPYSEFKNVFYLQNATLVKVTRAKVVFIGKDYNL